MKVLITGANGFVGKNLTVHLQEQGVEVVRFTHDMVPSDLNDCIQGVNFIFHLAGVNRPKEISEFA